MPAQAGTAPAIVVLGAGECGTRAAFTLREQGWDGRIVLVGAEPPYERPPLSKTGWPARRTARSSGCGRTAWRSGSACRMAAGW
jgi:glycine/D-amino acid oxidase-like deaminating enzyme